MKEVKENALNDSLSELSDLAMDLVKVKQYAHLHNCFALINQLLVSYTNQYTQTSKALLTSLYCFLDQCEHKAEVLALFPPGMRADYNRHIHTNIPALKNDYREFVIHLN